jgi:PAS domain S-box-containing protein
MVDDEVEMTDLARLFLERSGTISIDAVHSVTEALDRLDHETFDGVISDYEMPGMNGIAFLKVLRASQNTIPFVIFTGHGREEVVIEALNSGADYYLQKGGEARAQYAELAHKIRRAVAEREQERQIREMHEVLSAILSASSHGIALIRGMRLQWVNGSLAGMLGYQEEELVGCHLRHLYPGEEAYEQAGEQIRADLLDHGRSELRIRFVQKHGAPLDCDVHIAPLDQAHHEYGHIIELTDITRTLVIKREMTQLAAFPHLEINPVIEVNPAGQITYFNEAAIDVLINSGEEVDLQSFLPADIDQILSAMEREETGSIFRTVVIGERQFSEHITISPRYGVARISAIDRKLAAIAAQKLKEESNSLMNPVSQPQQS